MTVDNQLYIPALLTEFLLLLTASAISTTITTDHMITTSTTNDGNVCIDEVNFVNWEGFLYGWSCFLCFVATCIDII